MFELSLNFLTRVKDNIENPQHLRIPHFSTLHDIPAISLNFRTYITKNIIKIYGREKVT